MRKKRFAIAANISLQLIAFPLGQSLCAPAPPNTQQSAGPAGKFNPGACRNDPKRQIYLAIGRMVLSFPADEHLNIGKIETWERITRLAPQDPSEPEGCLGNPIQIDSLALPYPPSWTPHHRNTPGGPLSDRLGVDGLALSNAERMRALDPANTSWNNSLQAAQVTCKQATLKETLQNGLLACRVKPSEAAPPSIRDEPTQDWAAAYFAPPDTYSTPRGDPFAVYCPPRLFSTYIGWCSVEYRYTTSVVLGYTFHPYGVWTVLPIEKVIEFDRSVRDEIASHEIADYEWNTRQ